MPEDGRLKDKIKNFYHRHKTECAIYFLTAFVQLIFFAILNIKLGNFLAFQMLIPLDSDEYIKLGLNLWGHGVFSVIKSGTEFIPEGVRPPIYPAFVAFFYFICNKLWFVILIQNFIISFIPVMVYKIGLLALKNKKIAILGTILYILEPERAILHNQFLSDNLFILFFIISFYFYIKLEKNIGQKKYVIATALFISLATLTRPIGITMLVGYVFFIIFRGLYDRLWRKRLALIMIFVLTFFVVSLPWMVRNYKTFGYFGISLSGNYTLYLENLVFYYDYKSDARGAKSREAGSADKLLEKFKSDNQIPEETDRRLLVRGIMRDFKYNGYYLEEFLKVVKSDPLGYFKMHTYRLIPYFSDSKYAAISAVLFNAQAPWSYPYLYFGGRVPWLLAELIILMGIIFQLARAGFKNFDWEKILFILLMLGFAAVSAVNTAASRLRQPIDPFIFLLLSYYLWWFKDYFRVRKIKTL